MIQWGHRGESRGRQVDPLMSPEMIVTKTLVNYNKQDVRKSDEKLIARDRVHQYVHHREECRTRV